MLESVPNPILDLPSGLFEDGGREATALLQRMARGDGRALDELHAMWAPVMLGIATRMLGERRLADDLLRRVFVRIWKSAGSYDPHQSPPFVWAFAMLRDAAAETIGRGRAHKQHGAERIVERNESPGVMGADDCRRLKAALELLDPQDRVLLEQAVMLDFAHRPDGAAPGTNGSLKTRLRQALETVRSRLSRHEL